MELVPIAVAERECGISKDTLRVWERRYGFPQPRRDARGDRCYDREQIARLRLIKRLLDRGLRPAKIVGLPPEALTSLLPGDAPAAPAAGSEHAAILDILAASDLSRLREALGQLLVTEGLLSFVSTRVPGMNVAVGEAWARGEVSVAQEHLYTEEVSRLIRSALHAMPDGGGAPRVLLTTLPGEQHGLGLLIVEVVVRAHGATAINIGTEVPIADICRASAAHGCDVVAISFSAARGSSYVRDGIRALRAALPQTTALWAGGSGAARLGRAADHVRVLTDLQDLAAALEARASSA